MTTEVSATPTSTSISTDAVISKPTAKSEWTLIGALVASCMLVLAFGAVLTFAAWPEVVAPERIHFLGWALLLLVGAILMVIVAVISPSVGTVKASGMGADLEITGKRDEK